MINVLKRNLKNIDVLDVKRVQISASHITIITWTTIHSRRYSSHAVRYESSIA